MEMNSHTASSEPPTEDDALDLLDDEERYREPLFLTSGGGVLQPIRHSPWALLNEKS